MKSRLRMPSNGPFTWAPLRRRTLIHALLLKGHPDNAYIELVNTLAKADDICAIPEDFADSLNRKYRTNLHTRHRADLDRLFTEFLHHCLADRALSEKEILAIHRVRRLFMITDARNADIYHTVAGEVYRRAVKHAIADGNVTAEERRALDNLAPALHITEATKRAIYKDEVSRMIQGRVDQATADKMLSPQEDRELQELADGLGATPKYDARTIRSLNTYRMLWRIRYGELATFEPGINLPRGEVCYLQRQVEWHETRRQRVGVGYSGPTMRVKIADGVYWRTGAVGLKPMTRDVLTQIDSGTAYITNKRLLFTGTMKNMTVKLGRILDITKYSDGVGIEKDAGKSPVLIFDQDIDIFCATLARAISDASA